MLRVLVHSCDPGRVSDVSRLALCQTLSIECPSSIFFWHVYFVIVVPFSLSFLFVFFFCSHWSFVDVPMIFFYPADHVPDWQPRILLGIVEARSVNVKKTTIGPLGMNVVVVVGCFKKNLNASRPSNSAYGLGYRPGKTSIHGVTNPAHGLLYKEKRTKEKAADSAPPPTPPRCLYVGNTGTV